MKSFGFFFGIIIIAIIGYAGYYFYTQTYEQTLIEMEQLASQAHGQAPATASASAQVVQVMEIPQEWQTFRSKKYGYTLRYPKDLKTETTTEGDRFLKLGPTQSLGTELYDGLSLTIKSGKLAGKSVEDLVKEEQQKQSAQETTQEITEVSPVGFGEVKGFQFTVSSLGEATFIYIQKSNSEYLEIINSTVEPTNRPQTFQNTVNLMISSLIFQNR